MARRCDVWSALPFLLLFPAPFTGQTCPLVPQPGATTFLPSVAIPTYAPCADNPCVNACLQTLNFSATIQSSQFNGFSNYQFIACQEDIVNISFYAADDTYQITQPSYGLSGSFPIGTTKLFQWSPPNVGTIPLFVQNSAGVQTSPGSFIVMACESVVASPISLSFTYPQGGPTPAPQNLSLTNSGPFATSFTFSAFSSADWLSVSPATGATPSTVSVSVATAGLAAGTYGGYTTVYATGAGNDGSVVVPVTLIVASTPTRPITLTSITGWYAPASGADKGEEVSDAEWTGQPKQDTMAGTNIYDLFYAIDACQQSSSTPCLNSAGAPVTTKPVWTLHGSGFCPPTGCNGETGTVVFSDPSINPVTSFSAFKAWDANTITFTPSLASGFQYTVNPNVYVVITTPDGVTSSALMLPQPTALPAGALPWTGGVIATIASRGYGQCTWYVANQLLTQGLPIPSPAYQTTAIITAAYVPQQWDVVNFNTSHTAIIISPVQTTQVPHADGSTTITYSFTLGEMNVGVCPPQGGPCTAKGGAWSEQPSTKMSDEFVVLVSSTGVRTIKKGISSFCCATTTATACFRPIPGGTGCSAAE